MTGLRKPSPIAALRRVVAAPGLWLTLCALHLAIAWVFAQPIAAASRAAMQTRVWSHPDRLLAAFAELFTDHPSVIATMTAAMIISAAVGALVSLLVRGGVLRRLAGACDVGEVAHSSLAHLPVLALIGVYGLVLRVLLGVVALLLAGSNSLAELVVFSLLLSYATCTGDLAATRRVNAGERGVHPREYVRACVDVARNPRLWLTSGALTLARWACAGAVVLVAVHGLGAAWSPWAARALACVSVFLALWRAAVAVEADARARA